MTSIITNHVMLIDSVMTLSKLSNGSDDDVNDIMTTL